MKPRGADDTAGERWAERRREAVQSFALNSEVSQVRSCAQSVEVAIVLAICPSLWFADARLADDNVRGGGAMKLLVVVDCVAAARRMREAAVDWNMVKSASSDCYLCVLFSMPARVLCSGKPVRSARVWEELNAGGRKCRKRAGTQGKAEHPCFTRWYHTVA